MKPKSEQLLSKEQRAFVRDAVRDPVLFARRILRVELWEREIELLYSVRDNRRTAIRACHAVGKTFTLAIAALWWLARHPEGIVLTTSSTERQVRTQLWAEIHRLAERSRIPYPKLKATELKFRGDENFAIGFSTNQTEKFQGYHGKDVLIIVDEAPGIEQGNFDAMDGITAGGNVHVVMAGNPTIPSGVFFDAFATSRSRWNPITISAFDSPNLAGLDLERLLELDASAGGPLDDNPYPYLVTKRWVYEQYFAWWHGSENSSPNWLSRVLARFPDQAQDALIRLNWLERARQCAHESPVVDDGRSSLVAGVDVGGGESETVVYICEFDQERRRVIALAAWRGEDTRGRTVEFLNRYRLRLRIVKVDSIGVGHNFALHLRDNRFPVEMVNVSEACEHQPQLGENNPAARFVNQKAWFYQLLADSLERDQLDGLTDEATIGQLAGIRYEVDGQGRIKIESKEEARARGVASPDRAEALMLAFCRPPGKVEFYSVRDLPLINRHGRPLSSPVHYEDDDLDSPRNRTFHARRSRSPIDAILRRKRFAGY